MTRLIDNPAVAHELIVVAPDAVELPRMAWDLRDHEWKGVDRVIEIHNHARRVGLRTSAGAQLNATENRVPADFDRPVEVVLRGAEDFAVRRLAAARAPGIPLRLAITDYEPTAIDPQTGRRRPTGYLDSRERHDDGVVAFTRSLLARHRLVLDEYGGAGVALGLYSVPKPRAKAPAWHGEGEARSAFAHGAELVAGEGGPLVDVLLLNAYVRGEGPGEYVDEWRRVGGMVRDARQWGFAPPLTVHQALERGNADPGLNRVADDLAGAQGSALREAGATRAVLWIQGNHAMQLAEVGAFLEAFGRAWNADPAGGG